MSAVAGSQLENDRIIEEYANEESKGKGSEPGQTIPDSKEASKVIDEFIEEEQTMQTRAGD